MVNVSGLWQIVGIFLDFLPIAIVIMIISVFIAMVLLMLRSAGARSKIVDKMFAVAFLLGGLLFFSLGAAPAQSSLQAVGLTVDSPVIINGTVLSLKITGLTAATEYTVYSDHSAGLSNFTFKTSGSTFELPYPVPNEADDKFTISIGTSTAGLAASAAATVFIQVSSGADYLPTDFFFDMLTPLILIGLVVGIIVGIMAGIVVVSRNTGDTKF